MKYLTFIPRRLPEWLPARHLYPRLTCMCGALLALLMMVTGCSTPVAVGKNAPSPNSQDPRPVLIESGELAYLSIANTAAEIDLIRWQSAGWKLGNTIGLDDAVPTDCALHARLGSDTQVYAACIGPLTVSIPLDGAEVVYVTLIIGNDEQVRSTNVITSN